MYRIYSQSSLHVPSKNASRRKRMWSTQAGSSLLLFASRIKPAAEKRRSTAVEVAGASFSFLWTFATFFCSLSSTWASQMSLWCRDRWLVTTPTPKIQEHHGTELSNSLTKSFLLPRLRRGTNGDIRLFAVWHQARCDQSNYIKILPVVSFRGHLG